MKNKILDFKRKLKELNKNIRLELIDYFSSCEYDDSNKNLQILHLNNEADLDKVIYGRGFYIILTDKKLASESCDFNYNGYHAIYRGHSYFTKNRLKSHLSNKRYNTTKKPKEQKYTVCLKMEKGINGINIDEYPYKDWSWLVIIHKMDKSTKSIREQAEYAFDEIYGKPCKSYR